MRELRSVNHVYLMGNLGRDPVIRVVSHNGRATVGEMLMATNETWKNSRGRPQESTMWHDVVAWGSTARSLDQLKKGDRVYVEGRLVIHEGKVKIRASKVVFL